MNFTKDLAEVHITKGIVEKSYILIGNTLHNNYFK